MTPQEEIAKLKQQLSAAYKLAAQGTAVAHDALTALEEVKRKLKAWPPITESMAHDCHFDRIAAIIDAAVQKAQEQAQ